MSLPPTGDHTKSKPGHPARRLNNYFHNFGQPIGQHADMRTTTNRTRRQQPTGHQDNNPQDNLQDNPQDNPQNNLQDNILVSHHKGRALHSRERPRRNSPHPQGESSSSRGETKRTFYLIPTGEHSPEGGRPKTEFYYSHPCRNGLCKYGIRTSPHVP